MIIFCGGWFAEMVLSAETRMKSWQGHGGPGPVSNPIIGTIAVSLWDRGGGTGGHLCVLVDFKVLTCKSERYITSHNIFFPTANKHHLCIWGRTAEMVEENWHQVVGMLWWDSQPGKHDLWNVSFAERENKRWGKWNSVTPQAGASLPELEPESLQTCSVLEAKVFKCE